MSLSHKNQKPTMAPAIARPKALKTAWNVVAAGRNRTNHPLNSTIVEKPPSPSSPLRDESLMDITPSNTPIQLVRPFLKGIEANSVLIDVTDLKDSQALRIAMHDFNKEEDGYEDYLGRLPVVRNYLGRSFIETMWTQQSIGHVAILKGFTLADGSFVKGFESYSADSKIIKIELEKLPFLPSRLLKKEMNDRMSRFGQVLDLGIKKSSGCYTGSGYATIDISPKPNQNSPYEPLDHIILWDTEEGADIRHVHLQWNDMPDFCRICHASDHCRADCPKLKEYLKCHNCNQRGHLIRDCPRNNQIDIITSPSKKRTVLNKKERKVPLPSAPISEEISSSETLIGQSSEPINQSASLCDDEEDSKDVEMEENHQGHASEGIVEPNQALVTEFSQKSPNNIEKEANLAQLKKKIQKISSGDIVAQRRFSVHEQLTDGERQLLNQLPSSTRSSIEPSLSGSSNPSSQ
jgi:hypothetical protein